MVESPFAAVRLRTAAARRFGRSRNAVALVYKLLLRLSAHWRRLRSAHLCATVLLPKQEKLPDPAPTEAG